MINICLDLSPSATTPADASSTYLGHTNTDDKTPLLYSNENYGLNHGKFQSCLAKSKPVWDQTSPSCQVCDKNFMFIIRHRHHCRQCGASVCAVCSDDWVALPSIGYQSPVRVCQRCRLLVRLASRVTGFQASFTPSLPPSAHPVIDIPATTDSLTALDAVYPQPLNIEKEVEKEYDEGSLIINYKNSTRKISTSIANTSNTSIHVLKERDTLAGLAITYNTTIAVLRQLNPLLPLTSNHLNHGFMKSIIVPSSTVAQSSRDAVIAVEAQERFTSVSHICNRYHISKEEAIYYLKQYNWNRENASRVMENDRLWEIQQGPLMHARQISMTQSKSMKLKMM